jgi:hypothetical protein
LVDPAEDLDRRIALSRRRGAGGERNSFAVIMSAMSGHARQLKRPPRGRGRR